MAIFDINSIINIKLASSLVLIFVAIEWAGRHSQYAIEKLGLEWHKAGRYALYYSIIFAIFFFAGKQQQFIYFQF